MESSARKKVQREKPGVSKNDGTLQNDENILDSNIYLTYDILRIIFQYLDARDLASAAMVCRSWLEAANNEKWTRGPYCLIQHYKTECLSDIKNIRIKPSAGFFFIPENMSRLIVDRIEEVLLPEHCETIMLFSKGVIMDNKEMEGPFPCPDIESSTIVCAFLPQIPNVRIKSFKMSECRTIRETAIYQEIISTIVNQKMSTSNHEISTCLMLFCNYEGHTTAKRWASAIQKSKENIVSVWGGVLLDFYAKRTHKTKNRKTLCEKIYADCIAILITGHIQTWSTVLDKKCNTKERVETRLKLFKDEVKLKKHSIGFMFACKARGTEMYEETNVESTIFKKLFPKVPLAGCFGYGEFGKVTTVDEVNEEKNDKGKHKRKKSKSWYNEFSTVFLILTYG